MWQDLLAIVSVSAIILGLIERAALSSIKVKLDNIEASMNEIKLELVKLRRDVHNADNRITALEASVKSAHKRIDDMQEHCDKMHLE